MTIKKLKSMACRGWAGRAGREKVKRKQKKKENHIQSKI